MLDPRLQSFDQQSVRIRERLSQGTLRARALLYSGNFSGELRSVGLLNPNNPEIIQSTQESVRCFASETVMFMFG